MNENENGVVNSVENGTQQQPANPETKEQKPKKENWFKRATKKVGNWMSRHPGLTAFGGAVLGSAATVGVCEVGKRVMNRQQPTYIPQEDPNSLDPNV